MKTSFGKLGAYRLAFVFAVAAIFLGCANTPPRVSNSQGLFVDPRGIALDSKGRIYVGDMSRHQILRFDSMLGDNVSAFGNEDGAGRQFNTPCGLAMDGSDVLHVVDKQNNRVVKAPNFGWKDSVAVELGRFGTYIALGIALDKHGNTYITDTGNSRILRIAKDGSAATFGARGSGKGNFLVPRSIAIGPDGKIYILDSDNRRIVRIDDMTGQGWIEFGSRGSGIGQFEDPIALCFDSKNRLVLLDAWNHRIVRMDNMNGDAWVTFGTQGDGVANFNLPIGLAIDSQDRLYISDTGNKRVVRINGLSVDGWIEIK